MAATMAHEINNPLETITNILYLVAGDSGLADDSRKYLDMADEELQRVTHLTKQTLAFYRDNGKRDLVDLASVAEKVTAVYEKRAHVKRVKVSTAVRQATPVWGAAGELTQVLSNLFLNSLDATPAGGSIHIRISPATTSSGGRGVRVSVADTGTGIDRSKLGRIFEAFYTTKQDVGTGLGLYISRELIEKHNGFIQVRSQKNRGTVFSFVLPAESRTRDTVAPQQLASD